MQEIAPYIITEQTNNSITFSLKKERIRFFNLYFKWYPAILIALGIGCLVYFQLSATPIFVRVIPLLLFLISFLLLKNGYTHTVSMSKTGFTLGSQQFYRESEQHIPVHEAKLVFYSRKEGGSAGIHFTVLKRDGTEIKLLVLPLKGEEKAATEFMRKTITQFTGLEVRQARA